MAKTDRRFQRPLCRPEHAGKDYGRIGERRRTLPVRADREDSGGLASVVIVIVFIILALVFALAKWRA